MELFTLLLLLGVDDFATKKVRQVIKALETGQGMNFFVISIFIYAWKVNLNKMM